MLEEAKQLKSSGDLPWLMAGDFNNFINPRDKIGSGGFSWEQAETMVSFMDFCGFTEL